MLIRSHSTNTTILNSLQLLASPARVYPTTQAHRAVLLAPSKHSCSQLPLATSQGVVTTKNTVTKLAHPFILLTLAFAVDVCLTYQVFVD